MTQEEIMLQKARVLIATQGGCPPNTLCKDCLYTKVSGDTLGCNTSKAFKVALYYLREQRGF